jgi:cardiolipin synthase A/B
VAVLLLAYIGLLHLTRGTAVRHVVAVGLGGEPLSVHDEAFGANVMMLTGAELYGGHRVELALDGDGTYERFFSDLAAAEQSIVLQLYYGNDGRLASRLRDILIDRARAGVLVLLLYDAFGGGAMSDDLLGALEDAGVRVQPFRPFQWTALHLVQNRSHVRGLVVDGRVGWTGGFGIDDKWLGDGRTNDAWRETNVRFEGPAVRQMQAAFAVAWAEATGTLLTASMPPPSRDEGVTAGLLFTSPTLGSTAAERFLALSIAGARRTLYVTSAYFAPDAAFVNLLSRAAQRGVDVRILTAGPATDMHVVRLAGRSWYQTLLDHGVRLYEWQPTTLHPKTFVADGVWSTVGSMNFDNRSLALNDEATLMVHDEMFGAQMDRVFLEDLSFSREITGEEWRRRGWWKRPFELIAWTFTRLL